MSPRQWHDDRDTVLALARWLHATNNEEVVTVDDVLDLFEKPWKWQSEYEDFLIAQAATSPVDPREYL
jgi:hypothetical protein